MTDKVLIENQETKALEIKTLGYTLPMYDIGQTVGGAVDNDKFEGEITAIEFKVELVSGETVSNTVYTIDNSIDVIEEEITYYYDKHVTS